MKQSGFTILSVSAVEDDHLILGHIFSRSTWELHCVRSCAEAADFLQGHDVSVMLAERDLPDGTWKDLLAKLTASEAPPVLIVCSRVADDYLWAEVLNLGGGDVLAKPFEAKEVVWAVGMAWNEWRSRRRAGLEPAAPLLSCYSA